MLFSAFSCIPFLLFPLLSPDKFLCRYLYTSDPENFKGKEGKFTFSLTRENCNHGEVKNEEDQKVLESLIC